MNLEYRNNYDPRLTVTILILSVAILSGVLVFALSAIPSLTGNNRIAYEGYVMYMSSDWSAMFTPIKEKPYVVTIYPPIYMIIVGVINSIVDNVIFSSRIVSFLSGLLTAVIIWKTINISSTSENRWIPVVFSLLFLAHPVIIKRSLISRPDMLALLFTSIALYIYISRNGYTQLIGVGGFVLLALFTKQSFIALPLAIFLAYIIDYGWKKGVGWATAVPVLGILILLLISLATQGRGYEQLVSINSALGYSIYQMVNISLRAFQTHVILLSLFLLSVVIKSNRIPNVVLIYSVTSFIPLLLSGKDGSGGTLYLEQILVFSILGGILLQNIVPKLSNLMYSDSNNKNRWIQIMMIILIISQFGLYIGLPVTETAGATEVESAIQNVEEPILSENMVLAVKNDEVVMYQSFIYAQLVEHGYLDESPVTDRISNKAYTMIILSTDVNEGSSSSRWTPTQLDAIRGNYELTEQHGVYNIYEPN